MRGRVITAFAAGFAIGALVLVAALWGTGGLKRAPLLPWHQTVASEPPAPAVPDTTATTKLPVPPVPPPESLPAPAESPQGSADRAATEPATLHPATIQPPTDLHLAMPIANVDVKTLTDTFNEARNGHKHEALDIMATRGTPVLAVAEGNVAKLFTSKQGGLTVYQFDNSQQYAFYYAHLDRYAPGLKEGMLLRKGDTLGYVGSTGDASPNAPHLHFAVFRLSPEKNWWKGTALNPLPLFRRQSEPRP
jgi:murein DD-endopeptidase MepM/ murein hydrolase activator NlpD